MTDRSANKMWGGRFSMSPAEIMEEINASIGFDKVLAPQDIRASKAHAAMLGKQGIIGADTISANGMFTWTPASAGDPVVPMAMVTPAPQSPPWAP